MRNINIDPSQLKWLNSQTVIYDRLYTKLLFNKDVDSMQFIKPIDTDNKLRH